MSSKDLLIIALVVLLVGLLGYTGYRYFREKRVENARSAMQTEITWVAQDALRYCRAPKSLGGGEGSFTGFEGAPKHKPGNPRAKRVWSGKALLHTDRGTYSLTAVTRDSVTIEGVGNPKGDDGINAVKIRAIVTAQKIVLSVLN